MRLRFWPAALCLGVGLLLCMQGGWIQAKAAVAQILLRHAFAETVATGRIVKPWSWLDTWPVARITVPRLGQNLIILEGGSGQALAFGPAHVSGTPEAGEAGTAVYAAHRDTQFAFLGQLQIGDRIEVLRRDGTTVAFRVTGSAVRRWDQSGIDPDAPGRHLVLSTCWPLRALTSGPMRLLVHAEIAPGNEDRRSETGGSKCPKPSAPYLMQDRSNAASRGAKRNRCSTLPGTV